LLHLIDTKAELFDRWDELVAGLLIAMKKIASQGQTAEALMYHMLQMVGGPNGFLLVGLDEHKKVNGILFAAANTVHVSSPWIEIPILWSKPGEAKRELYRGFDMLERWAKGLGATKIYIAVMRSPDALMKHFYSKLGFEPCGIIAQRRL
jgi:hypothetical protein